MLIKDGNLLLAFIYSCINDTRSLLFDHKQTAQIVLNLRFAQKWYEGNVGVGWCSEGKGRGEGHLYTWHYYNCLSSCKQNFGERERQNTLKHIDASNDSFLTICYLFILFVHCFFYTLFT